eukprot:scaffold34815_cov63-Phaeocystis_antarctica.AAC.10
MRDSRRRESVRRWRVRARRCAPNLAQPRARPFVQTSTTNVMMSRMFSGRSTKGGSEITSELEMSEA